MISSKFANHDIHEVDNIEEAEDYPDLYKIEIFNNEK